MHAAEREHDDGARARDAREPEAARQALAAEPAAYDRREQRHRRHDDRAVSSLDPSHGERRKQRKPDDGAERHDDELSPLPGVRQLGA
jgi:hypothetical protein